MTYYTVSATISYPAWVTLEADTPEAALAEAYELSADAFDTDTSSAQVDFDVEPAVEPVK